MQEHRPGSDSNHEATHKTPCIAWLFDVDGVLTDPESKVVKRPEIFDQLLKRLKGEQPIGLNTGRSLDFIIEHILHHLEARVINKSVLQNLISIGEKGSVWICYDSKGQMNTTIEEAVSIPEIIFKEVREIVAQPQFADIVFFDNTKRTMVSVELRHGKTIEEFRPRQRELTVAFHKLLARHGLKDSLKIDPTQIAIDVENRKVGKAYGAKRFVELLEASGIQPNQYVGFGDSSSDYSMFEELKRLGKLAQFVFVGGQEQLQGKELDGVVFTGQYFDEGTLEYLRKPPTFL
jgi:HAD superfamily hydrolase (TIGR01484 family)